MPWALRKAAVWWIRSREREGGMQVSLHAAASPELL
jgi:phosphohistidine phosphatase